MIIGGAGFYTEMDDSRICWIGGRLGSGKTLLALQLAERYLKRGYKLYTNITTVWNDEWRQELEDNAVKAFVIVDEGGLYLRSMDSVSALAAYARKLDLYIVISGRRQPHEELCELVIRPWFDFKRNLMIPLWMWQWVVYSGRKSYTGTLLEAGRSGYYGIYDTVDPGENAGPMVEYLGARAKELHDKYGRKYELSDVARGRGEGSSLDSVIDAGIQAGKFRDAVALLEDQKRRGRGRKGRR